MDDGGVYVCDSMEESFGPPASPLIHRTHTLTPSSFRQHMRGGDDPQQQLLEATVTAAAAATPPRAAMTGAATTTAAAAASPAASLYYTRVPLPARSGSRSAQPSCGTSLASLPAVAMPRAAPRPATHTTAVAVAVAVGGGGGGCGGPLRSPESAFSLFSVNGERVRSLPQSVGHTAAGGCGCDASTDDLFTGREFLAFVDGGSSSAGGDAPVLLSSSCDLSLSGSTGTGSSSVVDVEAARHFSRSGARRTVSSGSHV